MAKNHRPRINVVVPDNSSVFQKKTLWKSLGYAKRTRSERSNVVDVLSDDKRYGEYIASDKVYCDFERDYSVYGHTIESTFYTDPQENKLLFVTVAHRNDSSNNSSPNQAFINGTSESENFVFASLFSNLNTSIETARGGNQCTTLESIQLFRYDPVGKMSHQNAVEIYDKYKQNYGQDVSDFYKNFFTEEVGFPHFHFSSKTMAETYGKTAESNAISLDKLIEYIEYLMHENNPQHVVNNLDFGMPYLSIKKDPNKYATSVDITCLKDALQKNNVNSQIGKIFRQTQKLTPDVKILTGLEGVYADLVLLRILLGERAVSVQSSNSLNFVSSSSVNRLLPHKDRGYIYMEERNNDDYYNEEKHDISIAEYQLASKVATAGTLNLKNLKGKDKLHIEEARLCVDYDSWIMLQNILDMCDNQKDTGGYSGPVL